MGTHYQYDATAVATELFEALYSSVVGVPVALELMPDSSLEEGYIACRIRSPGDSPVRWVLRAHRLQRTMPDHFCYFYPWACTSVTDSASLPGAYATGHMAAWLHTRANTLIALEKLEYPCPRVVPTRTGLPVGEEQGWCTLLTTFVAGIVLSPTLAQLRSLGSALGRLHTLPVPASSTVTPGASYWHPTYAIPGAQARLRAAAVDLPDAWRPWLSAFEQAIAQMEQIHLPLHLIHGDAWSANAVANSSVGAILIDWNQGGQGPAIADLGRLLLECHLDTDLPVDDALAWHIAPNSRRVQAVIEGYAERRIPTPAELEAVLVAMRFGIAFIGALHLDQALHRASQGPVWLAGMERRFARLQNRFQVSEKIAALAVKHFERITKGKRPRPRPHHN